MLADLYLYWVTTLWWWWIFLTAIEGALAIVGRVAKIEVPRRIFVYLALGVVIIAGFQAWRDEHAARRLADEKAVAAEKKTAAAEATSAQVREERAGIRDEVSVRVIRARRLTDVQRAALIQALPGLVPPSSITVSSNSGGDESTRLRDDFLEVFAAVKWPATIGVEGSILSETAGLYLTAPKEDPTAKALALLLGGLDLPVKPDVSDEPGLSLVVGENR